MSNAASRDAPPGGWSFFSEDRPLAAAGVGAVGTASFLDSPISAQPATTSRVIGEVRRQLKEGFGKIREGSAEGATQAAAMMRVCASTIDDGQLRAALRKASRPSLVPEMNHKEMERQAKELGLDLSKFPQLSTDLVTREMALDRLLKEGLSPHMREVAAALDDLAAKLRELNRVGGRQQLQVALRQPIPGNCGDCDAIRNVVNAADDVATIICAAALAFPPLAEVCVAAGLTLVTAWGTYASCLLLVALCHAYNQ